jgi:CBS domain-containing protein
VASGRPTEGRKTREEDAASRSHRDVPTCFLAEGMDAVRARVAATSWTVMVVLNDQRVVMGLIDFSGPDGAGHGPVEAYMQPAPPTVRPHLTLGAAKDYLHKGENHLLVTTSDGVLIGVLTRAEVESVTRAA